MAPSNAVNAQSDPCLLGGGARANEPTAALGNLVADFSFLIRTITPTEGGSRYKSRAAGNAQRTPARRHALPPRGYLVGAGR